jgi:hypothetical protein
MKINIRKENKPSYECMIIAETSQELALRAEDDWERKHHCYTGLIFLVFAVEAMFIFYRKQVDPQYVTKDDRTKRTEFHKETLRLCSMPNIRGDRDYQIVRECFSIRDSIAHGDAYESSFEHSLPHAKIGDELTREVLGVHSEQFRAITYDALVKGIEAAKRIDALICDQGYPLSQKDYDDEYRTPLMPAFGVSGVSTW